MKRKNYYSISTLIVIILITIISCSKKENEEPLEITQEIKDLIYFKGEKNASTVLIYLQGGPSYQLSQDEVDLFFQGFNTTDILMANVHQSQTLNPIPFTGIDITLQQAVDVNAESVENLFKVINYFKNQNRKVFVLGVSFGAFIAQELIAEKGIDVADKYLIITGRLDINDAIWQGAAEGKNGEFQNGTIPIISSTPFTSIVERNSSRIFAGLAMNRYTQRLNTSESLSNVMYVYGTQDEAVV